MVPAVRGMITDDTGAPLVRNQTEMVVLVNMMDLSQDTSDDGRARGTQPTAQRDGVVDVNMGLGWEVMLVVAS